MHLFKLQDFGFRGASSVETAALGGAAHLVNFQGSDNLAALMMVEEFYSGGVTGFSIPASEHSTVTTWGRDKELDSFKNMLDKYPQGPMACVSCTYNIGEAVSQLWGNKLKAQVQKRDGVLFVRPDSGELPGVVLDVLQRLDKAFPAKKTSTGHKLLPPYIRVKHGENVDMPIMEKTLQAMMEAGW